MWLRASALLMSLAFVSTIAVDGHAQEKQPEPRRGDPKSPGGRPLTETDQKLEELGRGLDRLKKEQGDLKARYDQIFKAAVENEKVRLQLREREKSSRARLEAAQAAVDLGRQLGGVSERASSELTAAQRERRALRDDVDAWERHKEAVRGAARDLIERSGKLDRQIESFALAIGEPKKGAPDSFGEIEKKAKELRQDVDNRVKQLNQLLTKK